MYVGKVHSFTVAGQLVERLIFWLLANLIILLVILLMLFYIWLLADYDGRMMMDVRFPIARNLSGNRHWQYTC